MRNYVIYNVPNTYIDTLRNTDMINSLYIAMEMNRLSLNADGVFRTITHSRIPQIKNTTSTEKNKNKNEWKKNLCILKMFSIKNLIIITINRLYIIL